MKLSHDPNTLRIPAFMRKRSLAARHKQPLVLTALDRKKAGVPVAGMAPLMPKAKVAAPKRAPKVHTARPAPGKPIGILTHYYDKIRVGVIALKSTLEVGDAITYMTFEGPYTQIVESMEIDRQPVFKAGKGKEIGLKLKKVPKVGNSVAKT